MNIYKSSNLKIKIARKLKKIKNKKKAQALRSILFGPKVWAWAFIY